MLDLAERSGMMWRSAWTGRGSEGEAVDTATTSGGDGSARLWERERERARQGESESVKGVQGGSVASQRESRATRGQPGRQLPAWHAAAPWLSSPLPSGRRKRTPLPSVGRPGGWAARWLGLAQGRPRFVPSLSLFYLVSVFYFSVIVLT